MVYRNIEETLNLVGMQVHRDEAVDTCHAQQVGHQLGADAHSGLVLAVLSGPAEVGDDGNDVAGGGTFGRVDHQKKLHQIVRIGKSALHKEYITAANGLFVGNRKFTVGEAGDDEVAEGTA